MQSIHVCARVFLLEEQNEQNVKFTKQFCELQVAVLLFKISHQLRLYRPEWIVLKDCLVLTRIPKSRFGDKIFDCR